MIHDLTRTISQSMTDQTEEFLKEAFEKSGLSLEEFVKIYILEEGPVHMRDSHGRDVGLHFSPDSNTVIFEQELRIRKRRPEEML
ncbi:DNA binding protein [Microbacterium phage Count]|nr:DNA binding protein [Microbacterium phage Count]